MVGRSMRPGLRFRRRLVAVGAVAYLAAVVTAGFVADAHSRSRADRLLDRGLAELSRDLCGGADSIIHFVANSVIRTWPEPALAQARQLDLYREYCTVDEITICDGNGLVVCSTDEAIRPGSSFEAERLALRTADYGALLRGERGSVIENFRASVEHPTLRRKYGAVAYPDRQGFVQIGFDEQRLLHDFDYLVRSSCAGMLLGETGYFMLVDPSSGRIVSELASKDIGRQLADVAPGAGGAVVPGLTRSLSVSGRRCLVRERECYGFRLLAVVPESDAFDSRGLLTLVTAVLLLPIFATFGFLLDQNHRRSEELQRCYREESEREAKDMAMAKAIQENALPQVFPPFPQLATRIDLYATMQAAREVGGDFYDFTQLPDGRLVVVVADVSGKGVPGALFMMRAKMALQAAMRTGGDLAGMIADANAHMCDGNDASMFVTAWIGVVDLENGRVDYVNAGHNPPIVCRAGGTVEWVSELSGPSLAVLDDFDYSPQTLTLAAGDELLLYTDGVTEAANGDYALWGDESLEQEMRRLGGGTAKETCHGVLAAVRRHVGEAPQSDDITLLAVRLLAVSLPKDNRNLFVKGAADGRVPESDDAARVADMVAGLDAGEKGKKVKEVN